MKTLKASLLILAAAFLGLFGYANLRILSAGEKQKPVELSSYIFQEEVDQLRSASLAKTFENMNGVKACAIKGKSACLIYYKDVVSETQLISMFANAGITHIKKKDLSKSASGCPVHGMNASFYQLISMLDLRSR